MGYTAAQKNGEQNLTLIDLFFIVKISLFIFHVSYFIYFSCFLFYLLILQNAQSDLGDVVASIDGKGKISKKKKKETLMNVKTNIE